MDIGSVLILMISFGSLIAFIMSENNKNNPSYALQALGVIL